MANQASKPAKQDGDADLGKPAKDAGKDKKAAGGDGDRDEAQGAYDGGERDRARDDLAEAVVIQDEAHAGADAQDGERQPDEADEKNAALLDTLDTVAG